MFLHYRFWLSGIAVACTTLPALTLAESLPTEASAPATDVLEEIIVTAQKRSERLQDVPVSVATLAGESLQALFSAGGDVLMLAARVPGLYAESSNGRAAPRFYLRGLGNSDFDIAASQPVSFVLDDVVMENVVLKSTPLFDIARVEILRGPQGSLFGRNTTAGIIKFDTRKPTENFSARADASYGRFSTFTFDGGVGGALVPGVLAARASLLVQHRDRWIDNTFTNRPNVMGGHDERAGRLQLLYTPNDDLSALLNIHTRSLSGSGPMFRANILSRGSNQLNANYQPDKVAFDGGGNNPQLFDGWGSSLKVEYDLGAMNLTSVSAFETTHGSSRADIDGGNSVNGPGFIPFPSDTTDSVNHLRQLTQELRLASNETAPFSWQAGAYFFDSELRVTTDPGFAPPTTLQHDNRSWALFGQASYQASAALTLSAGLRFTDDRKNLRVVASANTQAPVAVSDQQPSWDLSARYELAEDLSVYGKVARGFRGPTIQGRDIAFFGPASTANSETVVSWEAGLKSQWFARRVRLNAAVFTYTLHDPQFSAVGGGGNAIQLVNARQGKAYGFELDSEWMVSENLQLTAGYSYNHTRIQDSALAVAVCAQCTVSNPLNAAGRALVDGNPFPQAPRTIFTATARYSVPVGAQGEVFAYTDWSVQGATNLFLYESREFNTSGNFEGGLKVGYARTDGTWEVALFARNLTNEHNLQGGIDFNNNTGFVNDPRFYGISFHTALR